MMIYVSNQSSVVTNLQFQQMITAMNQFLITLCQDWSITTIQLFPVFASPNNIVNNTIFIFDNTDSPGALGYHFDVGGLAVGKVFAKTILDYGGVVLYKDQLTMTVAQCLCHEALEMIGNANINKWFLDNKGVFWAGELCDAVQNNLIVITLPGNIRVGLSDYVLPKWFSPNSRTKPFNKLNTLNSPFSVDRLGYSITIKNNRVISVYGESYPAIKKVEVEDDIREIKEKFGLS